MAISQPAAPPATASVIQQAATINPSSQPQSADVDRNSEPYLRHRCRSELQQQQAAIGVFVNGYASELTLEQFVALNRHLTNRDVQKLMMLPEPDSCLRWKVLIDEKARR